MIVLDGKRQPFAGIYGRLIDELLTNPCSKVSPRGQATVEISPAVLRISSLHDDDSGVMASAARSTNLRYLAGELIWYLTARRDVDFIAQYSSFWDDLADLRGNVNSAYGWHLFREHQGHTQWGMMRRKLTEDPDTRQAVAVIHQREHQYPGNPDVPCTMNLGFLRRGDFVNMTVHMRSSDVYFGLPYDVPFFMFLLRQMAMQTCGLPGSFTMFINSVHAYERNFKVLEGMLQNPISNVPIPQAHIEIAGYPFRVSPEYMDPFIQWLFEQAGVPKCETRSEN